MTVIFDYYTGHPSDIKSDLNKSMTQYLNNNAYVKVGITNNPERRWKEHKADDQGWSKMIVVYITSSVTYVKKLETELIDHAWIRDNLYNQTGGGGGDYVEGIQYVYFLVQERE